MEYTTSSKGFPEDPKNKGETATRIQTLHDGRMEATGADSDHVYSWKGMEAVREEILNAGRNDVQTTLHPDSAGPKKPR